MPDNLGFCFPTAKFRSGQGPEFGEVELIAFPFVIKGCQKLAVQRQMANLRTASADVEHAVSKFFPSDGAGEVVGGEPDPRTGIFYQYTNPSSCYHCHTSTPDGPWHFPQRHYHVSGSRLKNNLLPPRRMGSSPPNAGLQVIFSYPMPVYLSFYAIQIINKI